MPYPNLVTDTNIKADYNIDEYVLVLHRTNLSVFFHN